LSGHTPHTFIFSASASCSFMPLSPAVGLKNDSEASTVGSGSVFSLLLPPFDTIPEHQSRSRESTVFSRIVLAVWSQFLLNSPCLQTVCPTWQACASRYSGLWSIWYYIIYIMCMCVYIHIRACSGDIDVWIRVQKKRKGVGLALPPAACWLSNAHVPSSHTHSHTHSHTRTHVHTCTDLWIPLTCVHSHLHAREFLHFLCCCWRLLQLC